MKEIKLVTVLGARPQFIKASAVSRLIKEGGGIREVIVHTGQHYDLNMSKIFFDELQLPLPDFSLEVGSGSHGYQTGAILQKVENTLIEEKPDCVLVYGDTNSTLAGALAAAKLHIPIAHVEAGLRSFNSNMPEEINRVVTDHVSTFLFPPTAVATQNLITEGLQRKAHILQAGDVMYDCSLYYSDKAEKYEGLLAKLDLSKNDFILVTIHRAENTDSPEKLLVIWEALNEIAQTHRVVWPVHPRSKKALEAAELLAKPYSVQLMEPVGFLEMMVLQKHCKLVLTDSGGVQKEAFFHRKPCVTLREETEWTELVASGWNSLIPPNDRSSIERGVYNILSDFKPPQEFNPYGNGDAANQIVEFIEANLS